MTPLEAAKAVALLQAPFPDKRWTEATVEVYEQLLADLDFETALTAIKRIVCTSKFLPSVAEIREAVADLVLGPCRHPLDAWGDVVLALESAQRSGSNAKPGFHDALVAECVNTLGWRDLSNEAADRSRFCDLYGHLQRQQRLHDLSEPGRLLPGASDAPRLPPRARPVELPPRPGLPPRPEGVHGPELEKLLAELDAKLGDDAE